MNDMSLKILQIQKNKILFLVENNLRLIFENLKISNLIFNFVARIKKILISNFYRSNLL